MKQEHINDAIVNSIYRTIKDETDILTDDSVTYEQKIKTLNLCMNYFEDQGEYEKCNEVKILKDDLKEM